MADIKITFEEVKSKATQMRTQNDTLTSLLDDIKSQINGLSSSWTSDASDTIREKITALTPVITTYNEVIESYASFLDLTAETYKTAESTINQNIENTVGNRASSSFLS